MAAARTVKLKYGAGDLPFTLPENTRVLEVQDPSRRAHSDRFLRELNHFFHNHPLDPADVAVVVADKTRLCGYPQFLPVLIKALEAHGAAAHDTTFYIAYGTHPRQREEECRQTYGEVYDRCRFVHHDCTDRHLFQELGVTSLNTPVFRRKDLARASCVITFGAISHHYFAGYGGGRKLLFPGLGYRDAIYHNHGLFLDRATGRLATGCLPGKLAHNPLAEDLAAVEDFAPADLAIHGLLDSKGQVCDLLVGRGRDHFLQVCRRHGQYFERKIEGHNDLVVASCGGFPKDINFIQSHKALHNAAFFVKDGGELILLTECGDGIGSETFLPWFDQVAQGGWRSAFEALKGNYVGNGGTALAMMAKTARIRIRLVTQLPTHHLKTIGCTALDPSEVRQRLKTQSGSLVVIPNASMLVGTVTKEMI